MMSEEVQGIENTFIKVTVKTACVVILAIISIVGGATWVCASYLHDISKTQDIMMAKQDKIYTEFIYKFQEQNTKIDYNSLDINRHDARIIKLENK